MPEVNPSAIGPRVVNPPRKSRLLIGILVVLIGIAALTPLAIVWISILGKVYGTIVFASILLIMALAAWRSWKRRISEAESLRRLDKAMGKPSDDPRQMANFVP